VRLLAVETTSGWFRELAFPALPTLLGAGDLLVVNDAATMPASLRGHDQEGRAVEARLVDAPASAAGAEPTVRAVLLGAGDWRQRTEDRPPPPPLQPGARLAFGALRARVVAVEPGAGRRLVRLDFEARGADLWAELYRQGRPVQYAHLDRALPLWAVQTAYASRPWAAEMPSAGRPLSWEILLAARRRGVRWAAVTHGAGLSATGDSALDRALPLAERFHIPEPTVALVEETRRAGGRVIAVGTTVVRALEGAVAAATAAGRLRPGTGVTDLRIGAGFRPRVVDGILTGLHGPGESHFALLGAFASEELLRAAWAYAAARGFRSHELGDSLLLAPDRGRAHHVLG
jgi:S-adenosylmethionine:tRNA ribosyltransferase-isomerase